MGGDQTRDKGAGGDEKSPYSSYSIPTKKNTGTVEEIVSVGKENLLTLTHEVNPHIQQLNLLPKKPPILPDSLEDKSVKFTFGEKEEETRKTNPNLSFVNPKPLIDALAEFQTNSMRKACVLLNTQKILFQKMEECKKTTWKTQKQLYAKYNKLKDLDAKLKEIEYIKANVTQAEKSVDLIFTQLETLRNLIPKKVKQKIKTKFPNETEEMSNDEGENE